MPWALDDECSIHFVNFEATLVKTEEISQLTAFLRRKFQLTTIEAKRRPQKNDSCEVYIADEFIGVIYRDDEDDDDLSYSFQMAILDFDLEEDEE